MRAATGTGTLSATDAGVGWEGAVQLRAGVGAVTGVGVEDEVESERALPRPPLLLLLCWRQEGARGSGGLPSRLW